MIIVTFFGIVFEFSFSIRIPTPETEVISFASINNPEPSSFSYIPDPDSVNTILFFIVTFEPAATIPLPLRVTLTKLSTTTELSITDIPAPVEIILALIMELFATYELAAATIPYSPPVSTFG